VTADAFYLPAGPGEYFSTSATDSPWERGKQHGGAVAGLLARAIDGTRTDPDLTLARLTVDIHGPVAQGRVRIETQITREGQLIELVAAQLYADDRLAASATAWRIRQTDGLTADRATALPAPPVLPSPNVQMSFQAVAGGTGYAGAFEWRGVAGLDDSGTGQVWVRPLIPLVAGEETDPIHHLAVFADNANGLSMRTPPLEWLSIPPSLTVTVLQPPRTEWMCLTATTTLGPDGRGIADGTITDEAGRLLATVSQPLLVRPRLS